MKAPEGLPTGIIPESVMPAGIQSCVQSIRGILPDVSNIENLGKEIL